MKKTRLIGSCMVLFLSVFLLSGCSGKNAAAAVVPPVSAPKKQADHQVVVMLGSGYSKHLELLDGCIAEYGLADSGGIINRMLYPESFTEGKKIRLSALSDAASAPNTTVVVTVGAPVGTAHELAKIRNAHPQMQIITLFPMDNGIDLEASSDIVVDYPESRDLLAGETAAVLPDMELGVLIFAAMLSGEKPDAAATPLSRLTASLASARQILKQKNSVTLWKLADYFDADTNLRSWNHLVLDSGQADAK